MAGAPVGRELERYSFRQAVEAGAQDDADDGQGSIMMVVATDAPLSPLKLERLAKRAVMGLARTGSFAGNGSGDYVIASPRRLEDDARWARRDRKSVVEGKSVNLGGRRIL